MAEGGSQRGRQRGTAVNGILLLNKPAGMTSNRALQKVKRLLDARKAGHTGSLDPAATGMLPLCFGEATKVSAYLLDAEKTYRVTAKLGEATDTCDGDCSVISKAPVPEIDRQGWEAILEQFLGDSEQVPPMYSALKQDGKRLYELARKGQTVERAPRPVRISEISLLEFSGRRLVFRVRCSKGTYVRTLVEDIAARAGTVAYTARLHRESVGDFRAKDMLDMTGIETLAEDDPKALQERLMPVDAALAGWPELSVGLEDEAAFCSGRKVACGVAGQGFVRVYGGDERFLGIGELVGKGWLVPKRVFNLAQEAKQ
jgi:tRNA pseudouridine55 synthase